MAAVLSLRTMSPSLGTIVTALERSNATVRAIQRDNITGHAEELARFLPNGLTITRGRNCAVQRVVLLRPVPPDDVIESDTCEALVRWPLNSQHLFLFKPLLIAG
jgi:hypothetical protein